MRPKIVILTLVFAMGLVALAVVLKVKMGSHAVNEPQTVAPADAAQETNPVIVATAPASSNAAAITQQLRAAEIDRELDQIRSLVVEGTESPASLGILVGKVTHPEAAVRGAALQAVVSLNDTNAIPGLEKAAEAIDNPREKVAVLDAIAYLKLPDGMPDTPPTNAVMVASTSAPPWALRDPRDPQKRRLSLREQRRLQRAQAQGQPASPAAPVQPQPTAPAPAPAPPQ
jgi:hypothetical protein